MEMLEDEGGDRDGRAGTEGDRRGHTATCTMKKAVDAPTCIARSKRSTRRERALVGQPRADTCQTTLEEAPARAPRRRAPATIIFVHGDGAGGGYAQRSASTPAFLLLLELLSRGEEMHAFTGMRRRAHEEKRQLCFRQSARWGEWGQGVR